jgi:hypothetical protein
LRTARSTVTSQRKKRLQVLLYLLTNEKENNFTAPSSEIPFTSQ